MDAKTRRLMLLGGAGVGLWLLTRKPGPLAGPNYGSIPATSQASGLPGAVDGTVPQSQVPGPWAVGQIIQTNDGRRLLIVAG